MHLKRGFTLVELLVVIAIIGILGSIILVSLSDARTKAQIVKEHAHIKELQNALELYANNHNGEYPGNDDAAYDNDCSAAYFGGDALPDINPLLTGYINLPSAASSGQCIWYVKAPTSDPNVVGTWRYILLLDSQSGVNLGLGQGCYTGDINLYCVGMK